MSRRWRVVSSGPWELPGWEERLVEAGCEVVLGRSFEHFPADAYSEDELIELFADADAVIVSTRERITRRVMEACPRLKLLAKSSIGVELIDLEAAGDLGIVVVNSPSRENILSVAEATIGLIVVLTKRLVYNQRRLRAGLWKHKEGMGALLAGSTVGIVGLGRIGSNVARRLTGWDVRLLAADPYVEPACAYAAGVQLVSLEQLLRESDAVTLHVSATKETEHLMNDARLRLMKPTAFLVNTARGSVVDEAALARALTEGWISAAALDVFEEEPLPTNHPLRAVDPDRLIITPHCIGISPAVQMAGTQMAIDAILRARDGQLPHYIKNLAPPARRWRLQRET